MISARRRYKRSRAFLTSAIIGFATIATLGAIARADGKVDLGEQVLAPPPTFEAGGVTVDEKLRALIPMDATFRTPEGETKVLGDVVRGELPVILTFNYSDCPMLCSLQLNGLVKSLPAIALPAPYLDKQVKFAVGEQFKIVTIDLEPNDSPEKLGKLRDRYIGQLPEDQRAKARAGGWTFLTAAKLGDGAAVRRVAESVGFKYTWIKDRAEWAHPAALIMLSSSGKVMRYVYGIEFPADVMRESLIAAGTAEPRDAAGYMLRCYHYNPDAKNHSRAGVMALRVGAAGFVVLLLGFGVTYLVRRNRSEALRS